MVMVDVTEAALTLDRQIQLDLPRTLPENEEVAGRLDVIGEMLRRYCVDDAELGYVQGMNVVAAVFAISSRDDAEACARFTTFMRRVRGLWLPGFPLFRAGSRHFQLLAESRHWFQHMKLHIDVDMYLPQAWMAFFATWIPTSTLVHCLGTLEGHGFPGMLALTLAVLDFAEPTLMRQTNMEGLLTVFQNLSEGSGCPTPDDLDRNTKKWLSVTYPQESLPKRIAAQLQKDVQDAEEAPFIPSSPQPCVQVCRNLRLRENLGEEYDSGSEQFDSWLPYQKLEDLLMPIHELPHINHFGQWIGLAIDKIFRIGQSEFMHD